MRIFFAGDVVLKNHSGIDGTNLLGEKLHELVDKCDIVCCNLECPIYKDGLAAISKRGPCDYNDEAVLDRIVEAGFNMVTLANNHIMDYGLEGLKNTIRKLNEKEHFRYVGAGLEDSEIYRFEKIHDNASNVSVGIISVAEASFGTSYNGNAGCAYFLGRKMEQLLYEAKRECDYLIVVCHGGAEELNVPLPEFREVYYTYIDRGVDLVIAHHPHVIQGCECYKKKKIYYSLGNFAYDTDVLNEPYNPVGLCVFVDIDKKGIQSKQYSVFYSNGHVELYYSNEMFEQACSILHNNEKYIRTVNDFCVKTYLTYFRAYYASIVGLNIGNRSDIYKFSEHRLKGDDIIWDDLFVYHNSMIESVRWICKRAIISLGLLDKR